MLIWRKLIADPQIHIENTDDQPFRNFVDTLVPVIIRDLLDEPVTGSSVMRAQHVIMKELGSVDGPGQAKYLDIAHDLTVWPQAEEALERAGFTVQQFLQKTPGFTDQELVEINQDGWTIRDVLKKRPAVLLRPIFNPTRN